MLSKLFDWFKSEQATEQAPRIELAAAVIMIEIIMADHDLDANEVKTLHDRCTNSLHMSVEDVKRLLSEAKREQEEAIDLYRYTRVINDTYDVEQKFQLMIDLWILGYADGALDRYEDQMIRKVADLLYIPHSDFMMAKHEAMKLMNL